MSIEEIIDPVYTYFPDDVVDKSTLGYKMREYRPEETILNSAGTDNVSSNYTIIMDNHQAQVKLSDSVLDVRFKIINVTGANLASTDIVTIGANAQLMFQNAKLSSAGKELETIEYPGFANTVRTLMEESDDYIQKDARQEGVWLEKANLESGDVDDVSANPTVFRTNSGVASLKEYDVDAVTKAIESKSIEFNDSYRKRFFLTQGSQEAEVSIPLKRIFKQVDEFDGVSHGVDVELLLTKQEDYNLVLHGELGAPASKLIITDLRWRVPHLTPSAAASLKLQEELNSDIVRKLIYPNWHTRISQSYDAATTYQRWKVNTLTRPPLYAFVMFQKALSYQSINDVANADTDSDKVANPLAFKSAASAGGTDGFADINRVTLYIGGERKPEQDWRIDFSANDFSQAYTEFLRVCGKSPYAGDESSFVDALTFKLQYPMFAFDIRDMANKYFDGPTGNVDLELEWQVEAGGASSYRAYVVYADERSMTYGSVGGQLLIET